MGGKGDRYNGKILITVVGIGGRKNDQPYPPKEGQILILETCEYLVIWQGIIKVEVVVCLSTDLEMEELSCKTLQ